MKLSALCAGLGIEVPTGQDVEITGITDSSEKVQKGDLFVCIRGKHTDGNRYYSEAVQRGAAAVLLQQPGGNAAVPVFSAKDTRRIYAMMCGRLAGNPAEKLRITGITGTNGKTTVSWLLRQVLQLNGRNCGLVGTVENRIGNEAEPAVHTTPEPAEWNRLLNRMLESECTDVVAEISSQAMDQQRMAGVHFSCAAFTNLSGEHLDYHGTVEAYYQAKRKLFDSCECAVVGIDDPWGIRLAGEISCRKFTFSARSPLADYSVCGAENQANGTVFRIRSPLGEMAAYLPMFGEYNLSNGLCAVLCAVQTGIPLRQAVNALEFVQPPRGRMEEVKNACGIRVFLDYAHTPDALEKALKALRKQCKGRLVCLFGCGGDRDRSKRPEMGRVASENCDLLIVTSDNPRTEEPEAIIREILPGIRPECPSRVIPDRAEAIRAAVLEAEEEDWLLLAGKGHETVQTVGNGTYPFDERETVRRAMEEKQMLTLQRESGTTERMESKWKN